MKKCKIKKTIAAYTHSLPASIASHSDDGANIPTVHVGVQPEDAGVGVPKGSSQTATPNLPPLLLQPLTVRHPRLLVHLEAPEKHSRCQELGFGESLQTEL